MRIFVFAKRNIKELIRDPLHLFFTIGLPVFLMLIISFMNASIDIPNNQFEIQNFAPATVVFSFSFLALFASLLIAKDRTTSFVARLYASPMTAVDFILGYIIPTLMIAIAQIFVLFAVALLLGLPFSFGIVTMLLVSIPVALIFTSIGLLAGSLLGDKAANGVVTVLIQVVTFTSGMWFELDLIGGGFKTFSYLLPFAHANDALRFALAGNTTALLTPMIWIVCYAIVLTVCVVLVFRKKMKQ